MQLPPVVALSAPIFLIDPGWAEGLIKIDSLFEVFCYHVFRMQVVSSLEQIVEVLNLAVPTGNYERTLRGYANPKVVPPIELKSFSAAMVSLALRVYVDEWIETGMLGGGRESPHRKSLLGSKHALNACLKCITKHPSVAIYLASERLLNDRQDKQLGARGRLRNEVFAGVGSPPFLIEPANDLDSSNKWEDFFSKVGEEAGRILLVLIDNPCRNLVCKCRYTGCGRYFVQSKLRRVYMHGTFCSRLHQALACTRERRAYALDHLIDAAARQLLKWDVANGDWLEKAATKLCLAAALSQCIARNPNLHGHRNDLRTNWVNRHGKAIEERRLRLTAPIP